jgi:hypothetical protein
MLIKTDILRSTYPRRSLSGSIYNTVDVVVVLFETNLINTITSGASEICTCTTQHLLLPCSSKYGGELYGIGSMMVGRVWWRGFIGRVSPTRKAQEEEEV